MKTSIVPRRNGDFKERRVEGRGFHVLDIENLAGRALPSGAVTSRIRTWYCSQDFCQAGDQFAGACNHIAAKEVSFAWRGFTWRSRSGRDGADLALLDAIEEARVAERFSRVVIASGDGIFASVAGELATAGLEVTVVASPAALSRSLSFAASRIVACECVAPTDLESQAA